jgi:peptidoglycan/LPS O-acetylase OafA/YrhL
VSEVGAAPVRPVVDGATATPVTPAPAARPARPTGTAPRLGPSPALDGLRGVAVTLVVLVHTGDALWPQAADWLAQGGPLGVHLFFVLSGFLITTVLLTEADRTNRIRLGSFAWRRIRRLVPVLVALLGALAFVAVSGARLTAREVASTAGHTLTFTTNGTVTGSPLPLVTWLGGQPTVALEALHTWSLAIEVQFYLLWAASLWLAVRLRWTHRRLAIVTALVVVAIAVARAVSFARGSTWLHLYFSTWSRLDAPLVGSLVGICFVAGWLRHPPRWLVPAGVTGLVALLGCAFGTDWSIGALPAGLYTVLAVGAALTIAAVVTAPRCTLARVLAWRPLVVLGLVSYSLYIWHYPIFVTVHRDDPDLPGVVRAAGGITTALVVAGASYLLIERRFLRRPTAAPAAPTAPAGPPAPVAVAPDPS